MLPHLLSPQNKALVQTDQKIKSAQRLWLGLGGVNMLFFYLFPSPNNAGWVNLPGALLMWFLLLMVGRWPAKWINHIALFSCTLLLWTVCVQTGGINSPSTIWFTLLPVAALMVADVWVSQLYLGVVLATGIGMFAAGQWGWIDDRVNQSAESIQWALALMCSVTITQQLIVILFGRANSRQMAELEKRNEDFERAQTSLIQAQSHKDEFIASMGHELRTPMNAILGLNDVLQAELKDRQEDLQLAELIRTSTEQLLQLVNDLLLLSQLEANRVELRTESVQLRNLFDTLLERWLPQAQSKGIVLVIECDDALPEWVNVDPLRLTQILEQLLNNAIKFTQQGYVSVQARVEQDQLRIDVQDTGPGIARDQLLKIFDRFEQADVHTNRAYGGTGIGLAISKKLAECHQGQLQVQSEVGKGAHFWLLLPLKGGQDSQEAPDIDMEDMDDMARWRVLVVDDNAVNLQLTEKSIHRIWPQAQVQLAPSGEQALQWLSTNDADVVIIDRVMPGMDGLELTRQIRQHERAQVAQTALLGLTAHEDQTEFMQCLEAGMDDVASKPITAELLNAKIKRVMQKRMALAKRSLA